MPEVFFDPIEVRDRVIDLRLKEIAQKEASLGPYEHDIEVDLFPTALKWAATLDTPKDFETTREMLLFEAREYSGSMHPTLLKEGLRAITEIQDCMRFFWPDEYNLYSLRALARVQQAMGYPVWFASWRFQEELKPDPRFLEECEPLEDFYRGIEVGDLVWVSGRWREGNFRNPDEGSIGEVLGFSAGLNKTLNLDYLGVHFRDRDDWIHTGYLYTLDRALPIPGMG